MQVIKSFFPNTSSPKSLSNEALLKITQTLVAEERKLTTDILWHMHEIQTRRLYAEKGYGSLFEYAVQVLGYSEAAAGRRIAAMRLLVEVPEIEPVLKSGAVNLSTLSTIQSFIQRKVEPVSKQEKKELVFSLQGKSKRECEKILVGLDPAAALLKEKERVVSPTQTEIRFIADEDLMQKLQNIKELDGHVQINPSYLELFRRMAELVLKQLDPTVKNPKMPISAKTSKLEGDSSSVQTSFESGETTTRPEPVSKITPPAELKSKAALKIVSKSSNSPQSMKASPRKVNSRYIPAALKREIWRRDQGQCSYKSTDGKKCSSRYALEIDHIQPLALGGKTESSNLRLLCRAHNQQQAVQKLGPQQMNFYLHQ